jgi:hypothetical protein
VVVFFTVVVMVMVMELIKLWEERTAIVERREFVYPKEGIAVVETTVKAKAVVETTLNANAVVKTTEVANKDVSAAAELTAEAITTVIVLTMIH